MLIRALTLDLDDTLWPVWPTIIRAEDALHAWLAEHAPRTAQRYSIDAMRRLRDRIVSERPGIAHDFTEQRRLTLLHALRDSGEDSALMEPAYEVFIAARNQVEFYPEAGAALEQLAARYPIAALTNGNADLVRIGIDHHFTFHIGAREHGAPKPHASIFQAACQRLELEPEHVLHVGDDPELDVIGAQGAGMRTAWINRDGARWQWSRREPDYTVRSLDELVQQLGCETPATQGSP